MIAWLTISGTASPLYPDIIPRSAPSLLWGYTERKDSEKNVVSDRDDRRGAAASGSVALFIDWDNFAIGLRQEMPEQPADVGPILRWARRFGPLVVCRAYGEWRDPAERLAIYNAGVEVVYAPVLPLGGSAAARNGGGAKSLADTAMAVDVTDLLNLMPGITTLVMATSDKDLIPVVRFAQRRGLQAIVVGSDRTAGALKELADQFISYRQLLDLEAAERLPILPRPATVPPVRHPRPARMTGPAAVSLPSPRAAVAEVPAARPTTAGSVFPQGDEAIAELQPAEPAAPVLGIGARRRRRGGRRRRSTAAVAPAGVESLAASGPPEAAAELPEATEAEPEAVAPAEGAAALETPVEPEPPAAAEPVAEAPPAPAIAAASEAAAPAAVPEPEPPPAPPSPAVSPRRPAPVGPGMTPVILPGERLKRFASITPVATESTPAVAHSPAEPQAAPPAPQPGPATAAAEPPGEPAAPAIELSEPAPRQPDGVLLGTPAVGEPAAARRRGRRRSGAAASAAGQEGGEPLEATASPEAPVEPPEPPAAMPEEEAGAGEGQAEPAAAGAVIAPAARTGRGRGRRRSSRSH